MVVIGWIAYQIIDWRWEKAKEAEKERKRLEEDLEAERYATMYT